MKHILVIDDEADLRELLSYNLKKEGFEVTTAADGQEGLDTLSDKVPDLILLDLMMPKMDGIEVCEAIRSNPKLAHILICFLTARSEDYSQIAGLDAGADDYIPKPVKPKVLISKINSLLRRKGNQSNKETINTEDLIIDREQYLATFKGKELHLPKKEFELLALLASKPGKVFERDIILDTIWGSEIVVGDRTIDVHVRKLREKIGSDYIKTVKGVGYKFIIN